MLKEKINALEQKKRIRIDELNEIIGEVGGPDDYLNIYSFAVFTNYDGCWDVCYKATHSSDRIFLMNHSTNHCIESFKNGQEAVQYLKEYVI